MWNSAQFHAYLYRIFVAGKVFIMTERAISTNYFMVDTGINAFSVPYGCIGECFSNLINIIEGAALIIPIVLICLISGLMLGVAVFTAEPATIDSSIIMVPKLEPITSVKEKEKDILPSSDVVWTARERSPTSAFIFDQLNPDGVLLRQLITSTHLTRGETNN